MGGAIAMLLLSPVLAAAQDVMGSSSSTTRNPDNADGAAKIDVSGSVALIRTLDLTANVSNVFDATIFSPPFLPESAYDNEWMGRNIRIGLRYRFR